MLYRTYRVSPTQLFPSHSFILPYLRSSFRVSDSLIHSYCTYCSFAFRTSVLVGGCTIPLVYSVHLSLNRHFVLFLSFYASL